VLQRHKIYEIYDVLWSFFNRSGSMKGECFLVQCDYHSVTCSPSDHCLQFKALVGRTDCI
jgi:ATP/maltotriose-dependent transcriptional regulator MalT